MSSQLKLMVVAIATLGSMGAYALPVDFDLGDGSYVDTSGTDGALEMNGYVYPSVDDVIFSLNEGESYSFLFANFWTEETWINDDDLVGGSITAYLEFDDPLLFPSVGGTSTGFSGALEFNQGWEITWADPVFVDLGNGGQISIELSDASFGAGFWQGPDGWYCGPGSDNVYATVTLLSAPDSVVPEPASMLLLGLGVAGLAVRRGRNKIA